MTQKRVLNIVTTDFGEIGLAMMFSRNQAFSSCFAIPEKMLKYIDDGSVNVKAYNGFQGLIQVINEYSPDIVVFFSAYLFTVSDIARRQEFKELKILLLHRKIKMLTSDPFARYFEYYPDGDFINDLIAAKDEETEIKEITSISRNIPHLYNHPFSSTSITTYSFYNQQFVKENLRVDDDIKRWTFVISNVDLRLLLAKYDNKFYTLLSRKIDEVSSAESNRIKLIVPNHFIDKLESQISYDNSKVEIIGYCTIDEFEQIIANSDVVFYWNVFSNSVLLCWYYNVPVLFFDKGHIGQLNEKLYEHLLENAYAGYHPEYVSIEDTLSPDLKDVLLKYYSAQNRQGIIKEHLQLLSPDEVVRSTLK